jgi:ABC-2 type transport system ATP-binding protein
MGIIEVSNLSKSFTYYRKEEGLRGSLRNLFRRERLVKDAVRNVSFLIDEGEIVGFLGPNGAGKTTTLKMLSGILFPSSGDAKVLGFTPWERKKEFKMGFAIVMGQKSQLWWDLPASESLNLNRHIYEIDERTYRATLDELAELLEVKDLLSVQVRRLSLGERMKMELIASLIHRPRVMFLDEPTIGLDIVSQRRIREFLKQYNREKKTTIVLTSHYMADIEDLCKRTIIINRGRVVYDGELAKVNGAFCARKRIRLQLSDRVDPDALGRFGELKEHDELSAVLEVDKTELTARSQEILARLPVLDFTVEDLPVEEGIERLFKKEGEPDELPA